MIRIVKIPLGILAFVLLTSFSLWAGGGQEAGEEAMEVMPAGKYNEAPMLAARVASGELPPVEERLPPEPIVSQTLGIGKYGGTLRLFSRVGPQYNEGFNAMPAFHRRDWDDWEKDGTYVPELLEEIQVSDDFMNVTYYVRPGVKWSDGEPVTLEDWLFAYEDLQVHPDVKIWGMGGNIESVDQLDEWTFRINFKKFQPKIYDNLATTAAVHAPQAKHYLEKWHIDYNTDADKVAKDEGFDTWYEALNSHLGGLAGGPYTDADRPVLWPWIYTRLESGLKAFERNPFYPKVDTAGNQLPYIDNIVNQVVDPEVVNLKIISGEVDLEYVVSSFPNFTLYKENEAANNYTVHELEGPNSGNVDLWLKGIGHADPAKRALYQNENFRKALSHALNRQEINDIIFLGKGTVRQATVHPKEPYYKPEWGEAAVEYDPALANRLLDEAGLAKKDAEGFRLDFDGNPFVIVIEYPNTQAHTGDTLELIKEYWEKVGVKTLIKGVAIQLFWEHGEQMEIEVAIGEAVHSYGMWRFARNWVRWMNADRDMARRSCRTSRIASIRVRSRRSGRRNTTGGWRIRRQFPITHRSSTNWPPRCWTTMRSTHYSSER
jgi:peptide/nickel transport system substrate-binding protein